MKEMTNMHNGVKYLPKIGWKCFISTYAGINPLNTINSIVIPHDDGDL